MGPVPIQYFPSIVVLSDSRGVSEDLSSRLGYFMGFCKYPDMTITDLRMNGEDNNNTALLYFEPDYVCGDNKLSWAKSSDVIQADWELLFDKWGFDKSKFLSDFGDLSRSFQKAYGFTRFELESRMRLNLF
jgi:hypothetical protein